TGAIVSPIDFHTRFREGAIVIDERIVVVELLHKLAEYRQGCPCSLASLRIPEVDASLIAPYPYTGTQILCYALNRAVYIATTRTGLRANLHDFLPSVSFRDWLRRPCGFFHRAP